MSESITLTERERAVLESLAMYLGSYPVAPGDVRNKIAAAMQAFIATCSAESASPPRVPGASAHPLKVGVESGPGQPTDYDSGYRAGIEAALRIVLHPNAGLEPPDGGAPSPQQRLDNIAADIRALADKPAPDAARKGG